MDYSYKKRSIRNPIAKTERKTFIAFVTGEKMRKMIRQMKAANLFSIAIFLFATISTSKAINTSGCGIHGQR
jgi:hypothetical protein